MKVYWFGLNKKVEDLQNSSLKPAEAVATMAASTNLPTVGATFADLAAARAAVEAQRAGAEARLDTIETKLNEVITKLKTAGIVL